MHNKSYWIWHYGDYEIFHIMQVHLRREERGLHRPAFWKLETPYAAVKFIKRFTCEEGYFICHIHGDGCILFDGDRYAPGAKVYVPAGAHHMEVHVTNPGRLSAIFIESDVCPSNDSWLCDHFVGQELPADYKPYFDTLEKNPEIFPFAYAPKYPVSVKKTDEGVLFDFGDELFGYLHIEGCDQAQKMDISYGESEAEALDTDYSYITDNVGGEESYCLKQRAFRYIYIRGHSETLRVWAEHEYLPLPKIGDFSCSDPLFNDIYATSAYTFHLNCREGFFDGIKRDRWVWVGDAYQSARINHYYFAHKEIEEITLLGSLGREPIEQHLNNIMDYSMLWIISLYEYYMTYADTSFLKRIYPMAQKLVAFCETRLNKDGFLEGNIFDITFIDWSNMDKTGAVCGEQMLLIQSYSAMAEMAIFLEEDASMWIAKRDALKEKVNQYYWVEEKGAFIDSYVSGLQNVTRHANIFAVMYDIATEEQTESILKNVLKNDAITQITTPYFKGYELDALAKLGEFAEVEKNIHDYWGGMLALGAKTIWEEYHPEMEGIAHYAMYGGKYDKSLCHAWGAGPIYLFGRYYLGVYPQSAGFETFVVEPCLNGLNAIRGTVPVNGGVVEVELDEEKLSVLSTRPGGTLRWQGKEYVLCPGEKLVLSRF